MTAPFQRIPEARCLECGNTVNALGMIGADAPAPTPGDLAACIRCCAVMVIGEDLCLRAFTEPEAANLAPETLRELQSTVGTIHLFIDAENRRRHERN